MYHEGVMTTTDCDFRYNFGLIGGVLYVEQDS